MITECSQKGPLSWWDERHASAGEDYGSLGYTKLGWHMVSLGLPFLFKPFITIIGKCRQREYGPMHRNIYWTVQRTRRIFKCNYLREVSRSSSSTYTSAMFTHSSLSFINRHFCPTSIQSLCFNDIYLSRPSSYAHSCQVSLPIQNREQSPMDKRRENSSLNYCFFLCLLSQEIGRASCRERVCLYV